MPSDRNRKSSGTKLFPVIPVAVSVSSVAVLVGVIFYSVAAHTEKQFAEQQAQQAIQQTVEYQKSMQRITCIGNQRTLGFAEKIWAALLENSERPALGNLSPTYTGEFTCPTGGTYSPGPGEFIWVCSDPDHTQTP